MRTNPAKLLSRLTFMAALCAVFVGASSAAAVAVSSPDVADKASVQHARNAAPLAFETNIGQAGAAVRYLSRGRGYLIALGDDRAAVVLPGDQALSLQMRFTNTLAKVTPIGERPLPGRVTTCSGRTATVGGSARRLSPPFVTRNHGRGWTCCFTVARGAWNMI